MKRDRLRLSELWEESIHCKVVCYPEGDSSLYSDRRYELSKLGITEIDFTGNSVIGGVKVLGKGCVGIVVKAYQNSEERALKIRRVDADRESLINEAEILKRANLLGVAPKLYDYTTNFILMELVRGELIGRWIVKGDYTISEFKMMVTEMLDQCYRLDYNGIDHGELSNASKHIIVSDGGPVILDFESASINRKPSNLSQILNFLLFNTKIAFHVRKNIGSRDISRLICLLKAYKKKYDRITFDRIIRLIISNEKE